ncbi:TRAP transporter large permease subunit [Bacillus sp. V3B]|uniref:TRAP transporter large permease subunit n=1 Tax=Bacillus sp. V3B TaxID=2804915 RepID=UPI00210D4EBF|nr:TRAP transporter large permease subunit [Bacillus sp. V3B]MCQ6274156.1 TRAP transporter large permease subunit [Bacillus sp. V3B]
MKQEIEQSIPLGASVLNGVSFFQKLTNGLEKGTKVFNNVLHKISSVILFLLMFLTTADVVGRYFFNNPITGTYELTGLALALMIFFSLGSGQLAKDHIEIDFLTNMMPKKVQDGLYGISSFVLFILMSLTTWQLFEYAKRSFQGGELSGDLGLPLYIFATSIGGIYLGVFTPSEAGGIGAVGAFLLTVMTKRLSFKKLISSMDETLRLTVMLFLILILIGAGLFGKFLALSQIPMYLTNVVGTLDVSPYLILALILAVYFILGMFLEGIAIMTLTLPIVYPLITQLGFDGLWFGIIMIILINIGVLTPPLGLSVYIIGGVVKDVPIQKIFRGVFPAIFTMVALTIILIIFPEIITFLPNMIR